MGIISRIRGIQDQAEYETQHRSSINRIEQQAYEEAKIQRAKDSAARKAKREAEAKAIANAKLHEEARFNKYRTYAVACFAGNFFNFLYFILMYR